MSGIFQAIIIAKLSDYACECAQGWLVDAELCEKKTAQQAINTIRRTVGAYK